MKKSFSEKVVFCARYLKRNGVTPEDYDMISEFDGDLPFEIVRKKNNDAFFVELAEKLRELWPPGDKIVNNKGYAWRDSVKNIAERLEALWDDRFEDKIFTIDECLVAARKYLAQFEHDVKYMQTLKFFIWKQKDLAMKDGHIKHIVESKFADILEGKADLQAVDDEWESILNTASEDDGELI